MKKILSKIIIVLGAIIILSTSCSKNRLDEKYADPTKVSTASVERQFTGVLTASMDYVRMEYTKLFVVEQPTMGHYTQVMGWTNTNGQYNLPAGPIGNRWDNYYNGVMIQYRSFISLYNNQSEAEKQGSKIMKMASTIYFYDHTQQIVDIWGKIPFSEAGMLRANSGDLTKSKPKYDNGEDIYNTMLDDLKQMAEDFKTIDIPASYLKIFQTQDPILKGDVTKWRKYCNSLRLRMLMRVSGIAAFQSRVTSEVTAMLANSTDYPLVESNDDNIIMKSVVSTYESSGLQSAFETWGTYDIAPYAMIENMKANLDPRLPVVFEPGSSANGAYTGLNPLDNAAVQGAQLSAGIISRYNGATFTRNRLYPGWLCTAGETLLHKAEAYSKIIKNDAAAKIAYESGIKASIDFYYWINSISLDTRTTKTPAPSDAAIAAYLVAPGVNWDTNTDKNMLIGTQEWITTGISQMGHTWAEIRRLKQPVLKFLPDNSSTMAAPPTRWVYPDAEKQLNGDNYKAVQSYDLATNPIFWTN